MPELIPYKISNLSNEAEHRKIATKLKAMSDEWDKIEQETGERPLEAFDYSFGLIMGKELIFAVPPNNKTTLEQKIEAAKWQ